MSDSSRIGTHELRLEGDLIFLRLRGNLDGEATRELLDCCQKVRQEYGQVYILFDNREAGNVEPEARRQFVYWARNHPIAGVANFGGGVLQRTVARLIINALRILEKKAPPQCYVTTEAEARDWLAERRHQPL